VFYPHKYYWFPQIPIKIEAQSVNFSWYVFFNAGKDNLIFSNLG
jgi:hypothetical protein